MADGGMGANWLELDPETRSQVIDMMRESAGWDREKFGLSEAGANARAQMAESGATSRARIQAGASTRNAQIGANATIQAAKMQHEAQMARLERLEIPQMEINRMDVEGRLRIAEMEQQLNRQQLGANVARTMAELGSQPGDWVKTLNYQRGISQTQVPGFLQALASNNYLAPFGSGTTGAPGANSLTAVINRVTGGGDNTGAGGGYDMDSVNKYLDQIGQNPHQYDLTGLTSDELDMLGGGLASRGFSPRNVFQTNQRSQVSQGAFSAA